MLQKVMRHGFKFWEAPRNTGPAFEDTDPEYQQQRERMRLRRMRYELLTQIVALVTFGEETRAATEDRGAGIGDLNAKAARAPYGKRKEDPNEPEVWGDLVQFSDEEPAEVLKQLGIPVEAKPQDTEPDMADIQDQSMKVFGVTQQEFFEQNRRMEVALCRLVSMALCRVHTSRTTDEIGEAHGRDHAAVCRAVKRVKALRAENGDFARKVAQIEMKMMPMAIAA
jgi:hypothetical protein